MNGWGNISPALWALQSLVLVSRLPFIRLFQALLGLMAPEYFDKLAPCLEAGEWPPGLPRVMSAAWIQPLVPPDRWPPLPTVCNEIDQWPAPTPGQTLNLPIMGLILQVRLSAGGDPGVWRHLLLAGSHSLHPPGARAIQGGQA